MRTKKQIFLYFKDNKKVDSAIDYLLAINVNFNCIGHFIRISQKTFKKHPYIDLYTNCDTLFSSLT